MEKRNLMPRMFFGAALVFPGCVQREFRYRVSPNVERHFDENSLEGWYDYYNSIDDVLNFDEERIVKNFQKMNKIERDCFFNDPLLKNIYFINTGNPEARDVIVANRLKEHYKNGVPQFPFG